MPKHVHLTHPPLDFWVTAALGEDSRDVGVGDTAQEAVRAALRSLGEPYANELATDAGRRDDRRDERAPDDRLR
jgi:hypothetical protein